MNLWASFEKGGGSETATEEDAFVALAGAKLFSAQTLSQIQNSPLFCNKKWSPEPGETIFAADQLCESVWFVAAGHCCVEGNEDSGAVVIPQGSVVGERHLIANTPFKRNIVAPPQADNSPKLVLFEIINSEYFHMCIGVDPHVGVYVNAYSKHDSDHLGLDLASFSDALADTPLGRPSPGDLDSMFTALDSDGDGRVELNELLTLLDTADDEMTSSVLFAKTHDKCCCGCWPSFEPELEEQFDKVYARANSRTMSESVVITAAFASLTVFVSHASAGFANVAAFWQIADLASLVLFAAVVFTAARTEMGLDFFERRFNVCAMSVGLVAGGMCIALGTMDESVSAGQRGRGYIAMFKLPVFLFGFSKLRRWQALLCFTTLAVVTQIALLAFDRYNGDIVHLLFAFCSPDMPKSSVACVLLYVIIVLSLASNSRDNEKRSRRSFLAALHLLNEERAAKALAAQGTKKLLASVVGQCEEAADEEEADLCQELMDEQECASDASIHPAWGTFQAPAQECLFTRHNGEATKWMLWNKHLLMLCACVLNALNYHFLSSDAKYFGPGCMITLRVQRFPCSLLCPSMHLRG
jgi:hypothetical protein